MHAQEALDGIQTGGVARRTSWESWRGLKWFGGVIERVRLTEHGWVRTGERANLLLNDIMTDTDDWEIVGNAEKGKPS
jgi:hypothetical protein